MANLNPIGVVRDIESNQSLGRQAHLIAGRIRGGGTHVVTIETKLKSILSVAVVNETDGTLVAPTIADSSLYVGTRNVSFTVANNKDYSYWIAGLYGRAISTDTTSGATTVVYEPTQNR